LELLARKCVLSLLYAPEQPHDNSVLVLQVRRLQLYKAFEPMTIMRTISRVTVPSAKKSIIKTMQWRNSRIWYINYRDLAFSKREERRPRWSWKRCAVAYTFGLVPASQH
jgi:hypothetical protein